MAKNMECPSLHDHVESRVRNSFDSEATDFTSTDFVAISNGLRWLSLAIAEKHAPSEKLMQFLFAKLHISKNASMSTAIYDAIAQIYEVHSSCCPYLWRGRSSNRNPGEDQQLFASISLDVVRKRTMRQTMEGLEPSTNIDAVLAEHEKQSTTTTTTTTTTGRKQKRDSKAKPKDSETTQPDQPPTKKPRTTSRSRSTQSKKAASSEMSLDVMKEIKKAHTEKPVGIIENENSENVELVSKQENLTNTFQTLNLSSSSIPDSNFEIDQTQQLNRLLLLKLYVSGFEYQQQRNLPKEFRALPTLIGKIDTILADLFETIDVSKSTELIHWIQRLIVVLFIEHETDVHLKTTIMHSVTRLLSKESPWKRHFLNSWVWPEIPKLRNLRAALYLRLMSETYATKKQTDDGTIEILIQLLQPRFLTDKLIPAENEFDVYFIYLIPITQHVLKLDTNDPQPELTAIQTRRLSDTWKKFKQNFSEIQHPTSLQQSSVQFIDFHVSAILNKPIEIDD